LINEFLYKANKREIDLYHAKKAYWKRKKEAALEHFDEITRENYYVSYLERIKAGGSGLCKVRL
jgi:hypothetical protein